MEAERYRRVKDLFLRVSELPARERTAWLDSECAGDAPLRAEVEALLGRAPEPEAEPGPRFAPGDRIGDRYRIVACLGQGGMGEVYRADDEVLDGQVALKALRAETADATRRLIHEVRLARQVTHPAVCRVYDIGQARDVTFFAMELVEGKDLASLLRQAGRLPPARVGEVARELCAGIAAAHAIGVLHRDLKPANVLLDGAGRPRITDFGIALDPARAGDAQRGAGTPAYMAPEQWDAPETISERTDLYAIGLLLYEMLTGVHPFDGRAWPECRDAVPSPPSRLVPEVPGELERLVLALLDPSPAKRPGSAIELTQFFADAPAAGTSPPVADTGERRQITVLACELGGLRQLSARLDPEDVRELARVHLARWVEVVEGYGGHVAEQRGEGLVAYFGYPQAQEGAAERAVRAGRALVDTLVRERGRDPEVSARVGVATGLVIFEDGDATAFGEAPELALRLARAADADGVFIGAVTRRLVEGLFRCEERELPADGDAPAIPVFAAGEQAGAPERAPAGAAFVGRDHELGLLLERFARAREGEGQAVLVEGEAGFGKSRLVAALRDRLAEEPHVWLEAGGREHARNTALAPIVALVRDGLDAEHPAMSLERLARRVAFGGLDPKQVVPLFAPLLSFPLAGDYTPHQLGPDQLRARSTEAIVSWLLGLSERAPVVFVLENLHWCDASTLELARELVERCRGAAMLVVLTQRPDFEPPFLGSELGTLGLARLTREQVRELSARLSPDRALPEEILDQVASRADGVPLFAEELVKTVLESGLLEERGDRYELASHYTAIEIPSTLQDSLMARLDRLGAAKRVAQLAAAIGREFSPALLAQVFDGEEEALWDAVQRLQDSGLLFRRGRASEERLAFKHALIQEVARDSLLRSHRERVHARIARTLVERFPENAERDAEGVARHAELGKLHPLAVEYAHRAARRAMERSAHVEARALLDRALASAVMLEPGSLRDRIEHELRVDRGIVLIALEGYGSEAAHGDFLRARECWNESEPSARHFSVLWGLYTHLQMRLDPRCIGLMDQMRAHAARTGDRIESISAIVLSGELALVCGDHGEATEQFAAVTRLYRPSDRLALERAFGEDYGTYALSLAAWNDALCGRLDTALDRSRRVVALVRPRQHIVTLATALAYLAAVHICREERENAASVADELRSLAGRHDLPVFSGIAGCLGGWARAVAGDREAGTRECRAGRGAVEAGSSLLFRSFLDSLLGDALGRSEEAAQVVGAGLRAVESGIDRLYEPELLRLRGELAAARGDGLHHLRAALALARARGARTLELKAALSMARSLRGRDPAAARAPLVAALEPFDEGHGTRLLRDARAELAALG